MTRGRRFSMTMTTKAMVLSAIVFIFLMMMVPVYQIGQNHEYRIRIAASQEKISQLEDIQRTLESEISIARSPEALIDNVVQHSLEYNEIDASRTVLVAKV